MYNIQPSLSSRCTGYTLVCWRTNIYSPFLDWIVAVIPDFSRAVTLDFSWEAMLGLSWNDDFYTICHENIGGWLCLNGLWWRNAFHYWFKNGKTGIKIFWFRLFVISVFVQICTIKNIILSSYIHITKHASLITVSYVPIHIRGTTPTYTVQWSFSILIIWSSIIALNVFAWGWLISYRAPPTKAAFCRRLSPLSAEAITVSCKLIKVVA